jgi:hypothetical protein
MGDETGGRERCSEEVRGESGDRRTWGMKQGAGKGVVKMYVVNLETGEYGEGTEDKER